MAQLDKTRTIILLIIFCVLGAYVLWSPHNSGRPGEEKPSGQALLAFDPDKVTEIVVQHKKNRPDFILRKQDRAWLLVQPKQGKANPDYVRQLLDIFQYGYVEVVGQGKQGLAVYGLAEPDLVLTLTGSINGGFKKARVMFGQDSPSKAVCYCRVEGDPRIFTVGVLYKRELEKTPEYFLRKSE